MKKKNFEIIDNGIFGHSLQKRDHLNELTPMESLQILGGAEGCGIQSCGAKTCGCYTQKFCAIDGGSVQGVF